VAVLDQVEVVDPASGAMRAIQARTLHDAFPTWSPDGTKLAVSQHDGRGRLDIMDADGGNRHAIVEGMTSAAPVAWSPDGTRIAFVGYRYPGVADRGLYVVGADGTGLRNLIPGFQDWGPGRLAWSPDGSMIAFATEDRGRPVLSAENPRGYVYVVDVATGAVTPVSRSHVGIIQDGPLAWRPGRMDLLYAQQYKQFGELGHEDVVIAERVGDAWRERVLVTDLRRSDVTVPMWLDAERFVYVRDNRLWVANVDGRPEVPIGEPALDPAGAGCVAPDGSAIAVPVAGGGIALVRTDGGPTIRVISRSIDGYGAACSWQALRP
jgi:dipeptidyl aminopeptidase/acylaminoacyl peptidase